MRPHLECGVQAASPCFKLRADILERAQRRGTKAVKGLCGLPYVDRVRQPNFFPLSSHKLRADVILAYCILNDDLNVNMFYLFIPSGPRHLREHPEKVRKVKSDRLHM